MNEPFSTNFEHAIKQIIANKTSWCRDNIIITSCDPKETKYMVNAYLPSLDRSDGSRNFEIYISEVLMQLSL